MTNSQEIFKQLCEITPGGVNSPFRSFQEVDGQPPVIARGQGHQIFDVDGRAYIDLCCAWGPVILGHSHPAIAEAVCAAVQDGPVFGAPTLWELEFARLVRRAVPSMEQIRFVNSGAEAVASALRVARGVTRRARILKFEGGYHGHVECLDCAGQEAEQLGGALALGGSPGSAAETLVARYNDLDSVEALLRQYPGQVAAVILEPITGSMGVVPASHDFLQGLRRICREHGCLIIFDEVLSGFRVALGGAQEWLGFQPDLTCLGKALAGGLPVGAYGGRRELMEKVAPLGTIYQAGTFCGNPITMRAGCACLQQLVSGDVFPRLEKRARRLMEGLRAITPRFQVQGVNALFSLHLGERPIASAEDLEHLDRKTFARLHGLLLERGVYLPPSSSDAAGITLAHDEAVIDEVLVRFRAAWSQLQESSTSH